MASKLDKRALLMASALFREIPEAALRSIEALVRVASYKRGASVFLKGDPGRGMMIVVSGLVKLSAPSGHAEAILALAGPGEVFGEIALLDGGPRTANAIALESTELLILDRREFMMLLRQHPEAYPKVIEVLCARLRATTEMVEDSLFLDLPARLGRALRRLAEQHGSPMAGGVRIAVRFTQGELGRAVGVSRESVNKQLMEWRRRSVVELQDGYITIPDMDALTEEIERRL